MMLAEETTVAPAALPLAQFKNHLQLGTGFADDGLQDTLLESFLRAAIAAIEARTGKILIERDFVWSLTAWRDSTAQALPVAPVSQIIEILRKDRLGVEEVIDPSIYALERDDQRPMLRALGAQLPSVPQGGSIEVTFRAGYAADWAGLPADLGQAVLMLAAHYYEYRNDTGLAGGCMPFGVTSLIERYRTLRLFMGTGS